MYPLLMASAGPSRLKMMIFKADRKRSDDKASSAPQFRRTNPLGRGASLGCSGSMGAPFNGKAGRVSLPKGPLPTGTFRKQEWPLSPWNDGSTPRTTQKAGERSTNARDGTGHPPVPCPPLLPGISAFASREGLHFSHARSRFLLGPDPHVASLNANRHSPMALERCSHGKNAPVEMLRTLHESQAGTGRHRCPNCAYRLGFEYGLTHELFPTQGLEQCQVGKFAPTSILATLPGSQGGTGRHRCTVCAFNHGFEDARAGSRIIVQASPPPKSESLKVGPLARREPPPPTNKVAGAERSFRGRIGIDYRAVAEENETIGKVGQALVAKFEKVQLIQAGRSDLADKVEIVAETKGDGLGYDVLSFTALGEEKYIEVKTTPGAADAPFFLTSTELAFSKQHPKQFHLFRVYDYDRATGSAQFYSVAGDIEESFAIVPVEYRVTR
jgi:hypothetical protein